MNDPEPFKGRKVDRYRREEDAIEGVGLGVDGERARRPCEEGGLAGPREAVDGDETGGGGFVEGDGEDVGWLGEGGGRRDGFVEQIEGAGAGSGEGVGGERASSDSSRLDTRNHLWRLHKGARGHVLGVL